MPAQDFEIRDVERIPLHLPFHPRCADVVEIRVSFWSLIDLYRVTTASGISLEHRMDDGSEDFDREYRGLFPEQSNRP